ncbi:Mono-/di-acylglycerol lipase, N-terminal [Dillenia turbinata]|uniref:Mono-/di-acylglycerol lipase, N-terminal n=1 Tax=Dillenia turbinata TaxID=194707 RepID=A0AAN8ZDX7_9MAGN
MAVATTMATAAGAAVLLYYMFSRRLLLTKSETDGGVDKTVENESSKSATRSGRRRIARRPAQAPATWFEAITTLSETLRFTYSETLGKWPIGDLAFGINYLMRRQGNLHAASAYAGSDCVQLKGPEIVAELHHYIRLVTLCMLFSKKPFPVFLELSGYSQADVLLEKPKAGLLKPAFTIICDKVLKCFILVVRGTHSIKDTLTAVTGAVVPFHHSLLHDGGISNLVLGYAHCGMVAAARWIAKLSTPTLLKALEEHPDYDIKFMVLLHHAQRHVLCLFPLFPLVMGNTLFLSQLSLLTIVSSLKIIGHSLGGGTAALLAYILREHKEFSSTTCVTFGPAACMTFDLAESGKHFITTIVNNSDLVPTFSAASMDGLRTEVTASSWLNDLRDQVEHTRVINVVYRSATALGSRLPSIATAKAKVAGAGALLRPVSSSTQVVMKRAQNVAEAVVRTHSTLSSWSCMGARRRAVAPLSKGEDPAEASLIPERTSESLVVTEVVTRDHALEEYSSSGGASGHDETDEEQNPNVKGITTSATYDMTEGELWYELEKELWSRGTETIAQAKEEEAAAAKEITEEEAVLAEVGSKGTTASTSEVSETVRFYPPGRIMHMVSMPPLDSADSSTDGSIERQECVGIYETPRELYSKIRLSKTLIKDHFMPMYRKMMEQIIVELEKGEASSVFLG